MRKKLKQIALVVCCLTLALAPVQKVQAAEVPYQSFTYDKWGKATPAPNGYLPVRNLTGNELGCGDFNGAMDLFYSKERGEIYVSDTGNGRIVVLNEEFELKKELQVLTQPDGTEYYLNSPRGVFVQEDGTIYIAEFGNQEVVICDADGRIDRILGTPESPLLPDNFNYQPKSVVVDETGRIYVLAQGIYQGIIYLNPDGTFIKFFGPNDVEMTWQRNLKKFWKTILSDKAAATIQDFNPIEYGNMFLAEDGYIYAVAAGSEKSLMGKSLFTRLNPLGINTAAYKIGADLLFSDVTVDENGVATFIDTIYGTIHQFDETGRSMFFFGGKGNQIGLFKKPVSLIEVKGHLFILDSEKNMITEFELTQFGEQVRTAIALYSEGLYEESIEPWQEVLQSDANFVTAYIGLGKAYYQLEDYVTAMYYFKMANAKTEYSDAFKEESLNSMRDLFGVIVLGVVSAVILIIVMKKTVRKRKLRKEAGT